MMPQAGGQYVYLREAYGGMSAFLFGWTLLLVDADRHDRGGRRRLRALQRRALAGDRPARCGSDRRRRALNAERAGAIAVIAFLTFVNLRGLDLGRRCRIFSPAPSCSRCDDQSCSDVSLRATLAPSRSTSAARWLRLRTHPLDGFRSPPSAPRWSGRCSPPMPGRPSPLPRPRFATPGATFRSRSRSAPAW